MGLSDYMWSPMGNEPKDSDARKGPWDQAPEGIKKIISSFVTMPANHAVTPDAEKITPLDQLHADIKESGLKGDLISSISEISGKYMPGTREYLGQLGLLAEQNGLKPTQGALFGGFSEMLNPKLGELKAKQEMATKLGMIDLQSKQETLLELNKKLAGAPKTYGEVQDAGLGGLIKPLNSQQFSPTTNPDGSPVSPLTNRDSTLSPWQRGMAVDAMKAMAGGHLMPSGNEIVPTSFASAQGRQVTPEQFSAAAQAAITPPDQAASIGVSMPASLANKILEERGQGARQTLKSPDLDNKLEMNAMLYGQTTHGKPLTFSQLTAIDPAGADQVKQRTITEAKDFEQYRQGLIRQGQLSVAGPIVDAKAAAERRQPLGGEISKYGKMSSDGRSVNKPTDAKLTQDDLIKQGYVDLSRYKTEVDGVHDLDIIQKDFNKLRNYADELFKAGPGIMNAASQAGAIGVARLTNGGKVTGIKGSNGKYMTLGELANTYKREVESMLEYYGRNLKGLRGAATEGDVNRMRQNFASEFTDRNTKDQLFSDTNKLIDDIRAGAMRTMFGDDAVKKSSPNAAKTETKTAETRFHELRKSGLKENEIYKKLYEEGYR